MSSLIPDIILNVHGNSDLGYVLKESSDMYDISLEYMYGGYNIGNNVTARILGLNELFNTNHGVYVNKVLLEHTIFSTNPAYQPHDIKHLESEEAYLRILETNQIETYLTIKDLEHIKNLSEKFKDFNMTEFHDKDYFYFLGWKDASPRSNNPKGVFLLWDV